MYTSSFTTSLRPIACLDKTNRQLIEKQRIPAKTRKVEREDYEYHRYGVVDLFVAFELLACKRVVKLTRTRTAVDLPIFCLTGGLSSAATVKNVLAMDNLNIHSIASLYKAPAQARQIIQRLGIHYTPIHAPWSNMEEG